MCCVVCIHHLCDLENILQLFPLGRVFTDPEARCRPARSRHVAGDTGTFQAKLSFRVGAWDSGSGPHICAPSTLTCRLPSPQLIFVEETPDARQGLCHCAKRSLPVCHFFLSSFETGSHHIPQLAGNCYINHSGLKLTEVLLPLFPGVGIKGVALFTCYYFVCVSFLACMRKRVPHARSALEVRRGCWTLWNCSYRWL